MYEELIRHVKEVGILNSISEHLEWDELTMMPKGAAHVRAAQVGTLAAVKHRLFTDPKVGELLAAIDRGLLSEEELAHVEEIEHEYTRSTGVPTRLVEEAAHLSVESNQAWEKAREGNSFADFAPYLERFVAIRKEIAHCVDPNRDPYQILCEDYESGVTVAEFDAFFSQIKATVVPLLQEIVKRPVPDTSVLRAKTSDRKQMGANKRFAHLLGYDFKKGRLDTAVHPFCAGFGRITTRFDHGWWDSLTSTIHELGHAKYEHNLPFGHFGTPLGNARSMGVHESQSLLWEYYVAKSWQFWHGHLPALQTLYKPVLDTVDADEFYKLINAVSPSLIRVEADEVTYPLHVILRFEIERELIAGTLAVKDIPAMWNAKMQETLGITPPTDTLGCLQDVHWGSGLFGYFPTYSLGNIIAAQLWKAANRDVPGLYVGILNGKFSELDTWLVEKIHCHGSRYQTKELVRRATGKELSADDYVAHLKEKFSRLYDL